MYMDFHRRVATNDSFLESIILSLVVVWSVSEYQRIVKNVLEPKVTPWKKKPCFKQPEAPNQNIFILFFR